MQDQRGGEVRKLDRAPGERYAAAIPAGAAVVVSSRGVRRARAIGVAVGAAAVTLALTTFDIGPGLLALGAAAGWLIGLALAGTTAGHGPDSGSRRALRAGLLAAAAMTTGLLADGLRSLAEGGVLPPAVYAWERFGPLAVLVPVVAFAAGAWRGR